MRSSIVVVPRERFTSLPVSLRSLFATIPSDVPVVVVEGATPPETRAELTSLAAERPFDLVSLSYMVKPNEARNVGVARTTSEFVVIADNDIEYEPGWLQALEGHAVASGSDAVAPLICIGPPAATTVHHAGGILKASRLDGQVRLSEAHRLMNVPLAEAKDSFPRLRTTSASSTACSRAAPCSTRWVGSTSASSRESRWTSRCARSSLARR